MTALEDWFVVEEEEPLFFGYKEKLSTEKKSEAWAKLYVSLMCPAPAPHGPER
jgi:hypothetical protein